MFRIRHSIHTLFIGMLTMWYSPYATAQTCSLLLNSDSVCDGLFSIQSVQITGSGTPVSYAWDLGDGNTASIPLISHKYASPGTYFPKVTVTFASGNTCTTPTVPLLILPNPKAGFKRISKDTMCFLNNLLILKDTSEPHSPLVPIVKRVLQFNNGFLQISTGSSMSENMFYENRFDVNGLLYKVTLEVTDTNGCSDRVQVDSVAYLRPQLPVPFFSSAIRSVSCDSLAVDFTQLTTPIASMFSYKWVMGDGTEYNTPWENLLHVYRYKRNKPPPYFPYFEYVDTFGCLSTYGIQSPITPFYVDSTIRFFPEDRSSKGFVCSSNRNVSFNVNASVDGTWRLYYNHIPLDSSTRTTGLAFPLFPNYYYFPECGRYQVQYEVFGPDCRIQLDTFLDIHGPRIQFETTTRRIESRFQCSMHDTVVFTHDSLYLNCHHNNGGMTWLWDFGNTMAPPCTTHTATNQNVGVNCRYSKDSIGVKHYYGGLNDTCLSVSLIMYDTLTGCGDTSQTDVHFAPPLAGPTSAFGGLQWIIVQKDSTQKDVCNEDKLIFNYADFIFNCGYEKAWINFDTACGQGWNDMELLFNRSYEHTYGNPCANNGIVVAAVVVRNGKNSMGEFCYDTAYYLIDTIIPKNTSFTYQITKCNPYEVTFTIEDTIQPGNVFLFASIVGADTLLPVVNGRLPRTVSLLTTASGYFELGIGISLIDTLGCFARNVSNLILGLKTNSEQSKTTACIGDSIHFYSSILYYGDVNEAQPPMYWEDTIRQRLGKERVFWDYGDGSPIVDSTPRTYHRFMSEGTFTVRMILQDSTGCIDTVSLPNQVVIATPKARIYSDDSLLYCAPQFNQFSDSTFFADAQGNRMLTTDRIKKWNWHVLESNIRGALPDVTFEFTKNKLYRIALEVESEAGCKGTDTLQFRILGPDPSLQFLSDTPGCAPYLLRLTNTSTTQSVLYRYRIVAPNDTILISALDNSPVSILLQDTGWYEVSMVEIDTFINPITGNLSQCEAFFPLPTDTLASRYRFRVLPTITSAIETTSPVCAGEEVRINAKLHPFHDSLVWNIAPDIRTSENPLQLVFENPGIYNITLFPKSSTYRCIDTSISEVRVLGVQAGFDINESAIPTYVFTNESVGATRYAWFIPSKSVDIPFATSEHLSYTYSGDSISFVVCQQVFNDLDCSDSICKTLYYFPELLIPNVFTPNGDDVNELFDIGIQGEKLFHLVVYNRWGGVVFESTNKEVKWNGKMQNEGEACSDGVYYYVLTYQFLTDNSDRKVNGTLTLIK